MTIYGWDASHYDGVPSGARVVSEGFVFMTHKAGGDANDAELGAWWAATKSQRGKLLLGAYWVLYPGNPTDRADLFLARLDAQCPGWRDGPFILQADCEKWNNDSSTKPGKADIRSFCQRLDYKMPKLTPIVYASAGQYDDSLSGLGFPLWNARYPSGKTGPASMIYEGVGGDTGKGWAAYSGQTPEIWQFTSSATIAGQTTCDANAYRGTLAQLTALLAPGWKADDMELTDKVGSDAYPTRTVEDFFKDFWGMRDPLVTGTSKTPALAASSPLAKLIGLPAQMTVLQAQMQALAGKDFVDEQAIVTGVLGGLTADKLSAAIQAAGITADSLAAAIPSDMAEQVAANLAARLQS